MTGNKDKSKNEKLFEQMCEEKGIQYVFEPTTFTIQPEMTLPIIGKVSSVKYTPDYAINYKGKLYFIEVKGYSNIRSDKHLLKDYRMFSKYIWRTQQTPLLIVTSAGQKNNHSFSMYLYKDKSGVNKGFFRENLGNLLEKENS